MSLSLSLSSPLSFSLPPYLSPSLSSLSPLSSSPIFLLSLSISFLFLARFLSLLLSSYLSHVLSFYLSLFLPLSLPFPLPPPSLTHSLPQIRRTIFRCVFCLDLRYPDLLSQFNKIAIQGTPQMAVDKEAIICLSRVYSYYFKLKSHQKSTWS